MHATTFDLMLMSAFGVIGFLLRKQGVPMAPLILGFVLGDLMEQNLRRALSITNGDVHILFESAIAKGAKYCSAGAASGSNTSGGKSAAGIASSGKLFLVAARRCAAGGGFILIRELRQLGTHFSLGDLRAQNHHFFLDFVDPRLIDFTFANLAQGNHHRLLFAHRHQRFRALLDLARATRRHQHQLESVGDFYKTIFDCDTRHVEHPANSEKDL